MITYLTSSESARIVERVFATLIYDLNHEPIEEGGRMGILKLVFRPGCYLEPYPKQQKERLMRDYITAGIRTAVQGAVTAGVVWLASKGVDLDEMALQAAAVTVTLGVVTFGLNWLEDKIPVLSKILSLGQSTNGPLY